MTTQRTADTVTLVIERSSLWGLAIDLGLLTWEDTESEGYSAWTPDKLCALWALRKDGQ